MHNGMVGGFMRIRRALLSTLSDTAYNTIQSFHSDSAVSFSIFLHHLPDIAAPQPPAVLLRAIEVGCRAVPANHAVMMHIGHLVRILGNIGEC